MPAPIPYYTVNAFAPTPHGGNPAAVVLFDRDDPRSTNEGYMSAVAADFHLPMTAFLTPVEKEKETFAIRWFTPSGYESELCGHATLATALALGRDELRLQTRKRGTLIARRVPAGVALSLPLGPTPTSLAVDNSVRERIVSAVLRAAPDLDAGAIVDVATFDAVPGAVSAVVEIVPSVQLAELDVDPNLLLPDIEMYTVITQVVGPAEIASRVFIPAKGIPEDPVTGSAHAVLTEYYLAGPGRPRVHGDTLTATQASARGGALVCRVVDGRAEITGSGYVTAKGELLL